MKTALLLTPSWTEVARLRMFARKAWPEIVVWRGRCFKKATNGYEEEKYVEASAYIVNGDINITRRQVRQKVKMRYHSRTQL